MKLIKVSYDVVIPTFNNDDRDFYITLFYDNGNELKFSSYVSKTDTKIVNVKYMNGVIETTNISLDGNFNVYTINDGDVIIRIHKSVHFLFFQEIFVLIEEDRK